MIYMFLVTLPIWLSTVLYVILALVILMFMVLIHELGHYTAGKLLKFKINEFAIGMGPKLFSVNRKNGEVFSLRILPLGGFCAFEGENETQEHNPQSFNSQKPWKRIIVLVSGAMFNFISAVLLAVVVFSCYGAYATQIVKVEDTSVNAGIVMTNDIIYSVDDKVVYLYTDVKDYIESADDTLSMTVIRNGNKIKLSGLQKYSYTVTVNDVAVNCYGVGITCDYTEEKLVYSFGDAVLRSVPYCVYVAKYVLRTLGELITGVIGLEAVGGPITTVSMTSQIISTGFANVLQLIVLISVNLAAFNLLPVPALDGCQIVFVLIEWIAGKPINRNVQGIINFVGLILLLAFAILIDILKL